MKRLILHALLPLVTAAALLGGCSILYVSERIKSDAWTEESMLRDGWLVARNIRPQAIYCYRTLANPECYRKIQPGEQNRLVGYFDNSSRQSRSGPGPDAAFHRRPAVAGNDDSPGGALTFHVMRIPGLRP